jgi:CDP-diacylglycerol--glycerol-3-phosphate 3-phosphatidyltransferase
MPTPGVQIERNAGLWPPTWPMGLTMLRLLLLPVFLWAVLAVSREPTRAHRWIPIAIFGLMAITDKLDGYLARRLKQTSRLGAILDPVADKLLIACSVILLSFEWIAPPGFCIPIWVVVAVYGKDLITAVGAIVLLALAGTVTIQPRPLGKASTVIQLTMVLAVLIAPVAGGPWTPPWMAIVHALWWGVVGLSAAACADYFVQGWLQLKAARAARRAPGPSGAAADAGS